MPVPFAVFFPDKEQALALKLMEDLFKPLE
jgi:hypothetical protein